jgi:hypothetical protein
MPGIEDLYPHPPAAVAAPQNGFSQITPAGVVGLVHGINSIQGQQIANQKSAIELGDYKNRIIQETLAPIASIEDPKEINPAVMSATAQLARKGISPEESKQMMDYMMAGGSPEGIRRRAAVLGVGAIGAGKSLEPTTAGYDPTTGQPLPAPYGAKIIRALPGGGTISPSSAPAIAKKNSPSLAATPLARPAGPQSFEPPEGLQTTTADAQKKFQADQTAAAGTLANLRNLDIALPLVEKLNHKDFGPGSPGYANLRRTLITVGAIDPNNTDVPDREQVHKYLLKYATLAQNSGRSDQALGAALNSNPNIDLTQTSNLHLIKNQIALDKMEAARPSIFKIEHPNSYDLVDYPNYGPKYYNNIDRRVFSYDKLNADERRALIDSLGGEKSAAYKKFAKSYDLAKAAGFITPEKQKQ